MPTFSTLKAGILFSLLAAALVAMTGRVAYLQTLGRQQTLHSAERQQYATEALQARRGSIFDSRGMLLATTVQKRRLFVDPKFIDECYRGTVHKPADLDKGFAKLAAYLDRSTDELRKFLRDKAGERYLIVAEDLDDRVCDAIEKLKLPGIGLEATSKRVYPSGSIAAHIVGTVGKDDSGIAERGLEGMELAQDKALAGKPGHKRTIRTSKGRQIGTTAEDYVAPEHGRHLILTIDANIQMMAEQELADACERNKAKRGELIVIDPRTGDVLALANWPTFNPEKVIEEANAADEAGRRRYQELRRNRSLTDPFECGSVIKPFFAGPALEWGVTRPEHMWPIPGISYVPPGKKRKISDVHGYPPLCTWDVLVKSSNIGMAMMGEAMGNPKLYRALKAFGFGESTGLELPGEDRGVVHDLRKWTRDSTESVVQGYELMVTPVQLTRAFCAYAADDGRLPQLRLIQGHLDAQGGVKVRREPLARDMLPQAVAPEAVRQIRRMLCDVVIRGTAREDGRSAFYNIFGKTGTAHISEGRAGYSATRFNSSFICGAPYERPRLVVGVFIHEPDRSIAHYGGAVSAGAARQLVDRALTYLQVEQSPDLAPPPPQVAGVLYNYNAELYKKPTTIKDGVSEARAGRE